MTGQDARAGRRDHVFASRLGDMTRVPSTQATPVSDSLLQPARPAPVFLALAAVLIWRFRRTGGAQMLAMMDLSSDEMSAMG